MVMVARWAERKRETLRGDWSRLVNSGFLHVMVVTFGVRGAGFIQQIGLARILEPAEFGKAMFVLRFLTMICVMADLGISSSLLKFSAEPVSEEQKNNIYLTSIVSVACVSSLTALLFGATVVFTGGLGGGEALLLPLMIGALFIPANSLRKLPPMFMQAQKKIKQASIISGKLHLLLLILILSGAYFYRFWGYLIFMIAGQVIAAAVFLFVTRTSLTGGHIKWQIFKQLSNFGFFSMLANFSGIINASLGVLMLKWFDASFEEIAMYGVASVVVNGIRLLPQSLLRTSFPYLVASVNNPQILKKKTDEIVLKQGVAVILISLAAGVCGYWLLPLLFGYQYQASWPVTVVLLFSLTFWAIGAGYGQLQMALNLVRVNFGISFTQLVVNIILACLLIPALGAIGAAAALCFSYMLHTIFLAISGHMALKNHASNIKITS